MMEADSEDDETIEFEIEIVDSYCSISSSSSSSSITSTSSPTSSSSSSSGHLPAEPEDPSPNRQNEEQTTVTVDTEENLVVEESSLPDDSGECTLAASTSLSPTEKLVEKETVQEPQILEQIASDLQIHSAVAQENYTEPPTQFVFTETCSEELKIPSIEYRLEELKNPILELAQFLDVNLVEAQETRDLPARPQVNVVESNLELPEIELQVEEDVSEVEDEHLTKQLQTTTTVIEDNLEEFVECDRSENEDSEEEDEEEEDEFPLRTQQVSLKRGHEASEHYELGEELGRGKFGYVFKCVERSTGRHYAAKFVSLRKAEDREDVLREIAIMSVLQHRRLLQLLDAFDEVRGQMCLITELIEGGELFERIVDDDFELTEQVAGKFMRQICEGVAYMHSQAIVHLDMKPENILCASRESLRVKLIDFGLARQLQPGQSLRVMFGTPDFAAPEVLAYEEVSLATDMWSVGVICYVLLSGLSPFMGDTDLETMVNVEKAVYGFDEEAFAPISDQAKDFISRLLVRNQAKRMRPDECLKHPWLKRRRPSSFAAAAATATTAPAHAPPPGPAAINQDPNYDEKAAAITGAAYEQQLENMMDFVDALTPDQAAAQRRQSIAGLPEGGWHEQQTGGACHLLAPVPERSYTLPLFISLDKRNLKRYVVRRKWHRSVHAIMALGRMGALLNRLS